MLNRFKQIVLISILTYPATCFAWQDYGDWDYHGSGRDHSYSAYIDRKNYIGPADYAPIPVDYIAGPLTISQPTNPSIVTAAPLPATGPNEFTVYIPNRHGGLNAVIIRRAGGGFMGPDGEYYPEFPKVFQLQMKYGN